MTWSPLEIDLHDRLCHNTWEGLCKADTEGRCCTMQTVRDALLSERSAIVKWLRTYNGEPGDHEDIWVNGCAWADAIEEGRHLK